jgi:hypothetical protein
MQLKDFPLAWRWTNEKYALLPENVLSRIIPQTNEQAAHLFNQSLRFCSTDGLDEKQFSLIQIITKDAEPAILSEWLLACHNNAETPVFLSWQPNAAVSTTWGIFAQYWSEFCYPASDDLIVWSETNFWMLLYHHEELFQFGRRI